MNVRWIRAAVAIAVAAMGAIDLSSALLSHPPDRLLALERWLPTAVLDSSRAFTLIAGLLLLVTAWGLRRGKRRAFVAALLLCAISVPVNVLKALDVEEASLAAGMLFVLGVSGEAFRVKSRELTMGLFRGRLTVAAALLAAYVLLGSAGIAFLPHRHGEAHRDGRVAAFGRVLADAVPRLVGLGPDAAPVTGTPPRRGARWFRGSLPWLGAGFGMFVAISALAPTAHRRRREREIGQVAEIVAAHGDSSVAPFALGSDLDWYFSPTGRSVVAYRFESDVLLAAGDPIGPAEERALVTSGFLRHGAEHDWACAFYQARPEFLPEYVAGRMTAVHIGLDPVLDPAGFTLEGGAMGDVRRATRRLERDGIEFQSFRPADSPLHPEGADAALAAALRDISAEWLAGQAGGEKGFLMGRFDARELPGRWVVVARRAGGGRVEAFATWLAVPAATAWTLDLMRRRADAPAGVMDFLVARSVAAAAQHGDRRLSLGLCALAGQAPPGVEEAGAVENERLRGALRRRLAGFYDFAGVYHWKKKFQPRFEDRYLVVSSRLAIPRVALALLRAQSPHGLRGYLRRPGA